MDWAYSLLLILSAAIGALTGVFGQSIVKRSMRPRLNFELCITDHPEIDRSVILLAVRNEGRTSSSHTSISINRICKNDGPETNPTLFKAVDVNPGDCSLYELGYMDRESKKIVFFRLLSCKENCEVSLKIFVSSLDVKSVMKIFEISEDSLKKMKEPPENGIWTEWDIL